MYIIGNTSYLLVCPDYRVSFQPLEDSFRQDAVVEMNTDKFRRIWNASLENWVAPISQEIIFKNSKNGFFSFSTPLKMSKALKNPQNRTDLFSFSALLENQNRLTLQNHSFNDTWLQYIHASYYEIGINYSVIVKFLYSTEGNEDIDICTGRLRNDTYDIFYPGYWACLDSTPYKQELIEVGKLCDGYYNCADLSDESGVLCKPDISDFINFSAPLLTAFVIIGLVLFVVVEAINWDVDDSSTVDENGRQEDIVRSIIIICNESRAIDNQPDTTMAEKVGRIYTPCLEHDDKVFLFQILYTLSLTPDMRNGVWLIMDTIIDVETQFHGSLEKAKCCLMSFRKEYSYLSMFINDVTERTTFFSNLGRHLKDFLAYILTTPCIGFVIVCLVVPGLLQVGLFYYDILRDLVMVTLLVHVQANVLRDDDLKTRFDSVGGINFNVLIGYVIAIIIVGELSIYWQINNREALIKKKIAWFDTSLVGRIFVRIFPIHFLFLQMTKAKIKALMLTRKIFSIFRWNQLVCGRAVAILAIKLSKDLESLNNKAYYLNQVGSEMQMIQTAIEKEPQMVIQLCIFVLMQYFKRLSLLFDKSFGISTEVFFMVNLAITLLSIAKSIVGYLNAKRHPVRPNMFGTIIVLLAVGMLVISKLALVSITLLNAFYLYPFTHGMNIFLFWLYTKMVCGKIRNSFHMAMVMPIAPAFFKSSKTRSQNMILQLYVRVLSKCGPILNTIVLHTITFSMYSVIAVILRSSLFHFNINMGIADIEADTVSTNMESYDARTLARYMFQSPLQQFPSGIAFSYQMCIILYVLFSTVYYKFFHPWKQLILAKHLTGFVEDGGMDVRVGYGTRTSEPEANIQFNTNEEQNCDSSATFTNAIVPESTEETSGDDCEMNQQNRVIAKEQVDSVEETNCYTML